MVHGLGCAAELISKNLEIYKENMIKMRDLLEKLLAVRCLTRSNFQHLTMTHLTS